MTVRFSGTSILLILLQPLKTFLGKWVTRVFDKLIGHNKPAWVKRKYPLPEDVIKAIHLAGGIAVWAHPIMRDVPDLAFLMRSCRRLKAMGLDAIEGFYSMFSARESLLVAEAAEHYHLAISGGSDFHGENRPNVVLGFGTGGLRVPEELLYKLKETRFSGTLWNKFNTGHTNGTMIWK